MKKLSIDNFLTPENFKNDDNAGLGAPIVDLQIRRQVIWLGVLAEHHA